MGDAGPALCGCAIMAKASRPGRTKTRLTPPLSPDEAARLNTAFLQDGAANMLAAGRDASLAGYMAYGPPEEAGFFAMLPPQIGLIEAWTPDFGDTLKVAASAVLARGHRGVCLLNADSPTLPVATLVEAASILAEPSEHLVLGPSVDGGYYLVGMTRLHARLFEDVAWSTGMVLDQTLERAAEIGLRVRLLHPWYDVDDAETLAILSGELLDGEPFDRSRRSAGAVHTRAMLRDLGRRVAG